MHSSHHIVALSALQGVPVSADSTVDDGVAECTLA